MVDRRFGEKVTFWSAFNEPLIKLENIFQSVFAISVDASTENEVREKIKHANL